MTRIQQKPEKTKPKLHDKSTKVEKLEKNEQKSTKMRYEWKNT